VKVALVILHADPARGGAERYTIDLAAALARRRHDVSLLASSFAGEVEHVRQITTPARGVTRTVRYIRFLDALDAHLDTESPGYDVVHAMLPIRQCDVYHPHAGVAAVVVAQWNRLFNPRRRLMAAVERDLLQSQRPPITIALSEYVKRSIRQHYPLSDGRLATLFNAVDLNRFQPRAPLSRSGLPWSVVALMIAQDFDRKGLAEAIEAVGRVNGPKQIVDGPARAQLGLRVVGKDNPEPYRRLMRRLPNLTPVTFVGHDPDPRIDYATWDFFVLPTKHDPCSLVVLEALAMGMPVISTVFNGATEIMTDGVHGYVLSDPTDVDALADAMRKLLDPERRRAMSEACLALRPRLSYEHHVDELLRIYERARQRA
jgi:UDP-glucose:(heptosyl)LPS alpha-1,3-glucosyltransferase